MDSVFRPSILSKVHIMTMTRLPTYDIPLELSHKTNEPCHDLILVLIVGFLANFLLVICLAEQYYSLET